MANADQDTRTTAEAVFESQERRERVNSGALKLEEERHAAATRNMQRLRALRLSYEKISEHEGSAADAGAKT